MTTSNLLTESNELATIIETKSSELESAPNDNAIIIEGLKNDLNDAYGQISTLEGKLNESETNTISNSDEFLTCIESMNSLVEEHMTTSETLVSMRLAIGERDLTIKSLREQLSNTGARLSESIVNSKKPDKELATELEKYSTLANKLTDDVNKLESTNLELSTKCDSLVESNSTLEEKVTSLTRTNNTLRTTNTGLSSKVDESTNRISKLTTSLNESVNSYVKVKSNQLGLDSNSIMASLSENGSITEAELVINKKLDEKVRLSKVSIYTNNTVTPGTVVTPVNENKTPDNLESTRILLKSMQSVKPRSNK